MRNSLVMKILLSATVMHSHGGEVHRAEAAARHQVGPNERGGRIGEVFRGLVYPGTMYREFIYTIFIPGVYLYCIVMGVYLPHLYYLGVHPTSIR